MPTRTDVERWRAMAEAATPGPWGAGWGGDPDTDGMDDAGPYGISAWNRGGVLMGKPDQYTAERDWPQVVANARLAAASREAVPEMAEMLEKAALIISAIVDGVPPMYAPVAWLAEWRGEAE